TNEPVTINSFGDFERAFGGLQEEYLMSYAVRDFFLNGGSQAIIVRLVHPNFVTADERDKVLTAAKQVAGKTTGATVADVKEAAKEAANAIQDAAEKIIAEEVAAAAEAAAATTVADVTKAAQAAAAAAIPGKAPLKLQTATANDLLVIEAANEGEWGDNLG